jgi:hypothetical protein
MKPYGSGGIVLLIPKLGSRFCSLDHAFLKVYHIYIVLILAYDVACTQFRQDHFGLPEDGAPEAPKHVGASWYFKYMVYFEKCISLDFLSSSAIDVSFTLRPLYPGRRAHGTNRIGDCVGPVSDLFSVWNLYYGLLSSDTWYSGRWVPTFRMKVLSPLLSWRWRHNFPLKYQ